MIAYGSEEDGSPRVYVRPFPGPGARVLVSPGWGQQPRWLLKRNEIVYQTGDLTIASIPFTIRNGEFIPGEPVSWGPQRAGDFGGAPSFDLLPDGDTVVMVIPRGWDDSILTHLTFLINVFDDVKRRLP